MTQNLIDLAAACTELVWLYIQLYELRAEIYGMQLLRWAMANPDSALGTAFGIAGAAVLATLPTRQALGWLLFLASNVGLAMFGLRVQIYELVLLQAVFTITSLLGLWRTGIKPWLVWDEWRGDFNGNVTMRIKTLVSWRGRKLDLHQMVAGDAPGCFHTHPARAIRWVFWNGYVEEIESEPGHMILRGMPAPSISIVRPELSHRIAWLRGPVSYSLWLRGRKTHKVQLRGPGWPAGAKAA